MNEIAVLFAQVGIVVVATTAALAGIALGTRALWRLTSRVQPRDAAVVSAADFRRVETAVESIAIEVERISESQRFTVGLLREGKPVRDADRAEPIMLPVPSPRVNTPH